MFKGRRGPLVAGAIVAALVILLIFFLVLPKMTPGAPGAREDLAAAEAETSTLESQLAALEQAELNAPEYKATIQEVEEQIPPTLDQIGLPAVDQERRGAVVGRAHHPDPRHSDARPGDWAVGRTARRDHGLGNLLQPDRVPVQPRDAAASHQGAERRRHSGNRGRRHATTTTTTGQLQMTASVVLYTSDVSAGTGWSPDRPAPAKLRWRGADPMPLTPRDRRTLMIGGGILGFLLVAFFLFNNLSGGGDDGAIPEFPTVSAPPGGGGGGDETPTVSPSNGISPQPVFTGRDPFSIPPATVTLARAPDRPDNRSPRPARAAGSRLALATGPTTPTTTPPSTPGGNSSLVLGWQDRGPARHLQAGTRAQFEVDGTVYNVGIGDTFGGGSFELQSINGDCATFLYGGRAFHPLRELHQVAGVARGPGGPPTGGAVAGRGGGSHGAAPAPFPSAAVAFVCLSRKPLPRGRRSL